MSTGISTIDKKALTLLGLRLSLALLMIVWGADKLVNPAHGAAVADRFYEGILSSQAVMPALGSLQILLGLGVGLGLLRRYAYPILAVLVLIAHREEDTLRLGGGPKTLILFYRGHWCPYCRKQLEDFQTNLDRFRSNDIKIVALSADPEEEARSTVESNEIHFPVGFGLDAESVRETFGAYLGDDGSFVQATGFVLRPGSRIALAVYSSGAVGRMPARDVLGLIDYMKRQEG